MTPRQKLINALRQSLKANQIEPGTVEMNELVEDVARKLGEKVWQHYLKASDAQYDRLVKAAVCQ